VTTDYLVGDSVPVLWTIFLKCGVSELPEYHWPD